MPPLLNSNSLHKVVSSCCVKLQRLEMDLAWTLNRTGPELDNIAGIAEDMLHCYASYIVSRESGALNRICIKMCSHNL